MTPTALREGHLARDPRRATAPSAIPPDQWEAWRRRLELDDQVRAAAATMVESRMPSAPAAPGRSGAVRAGVLVAVAAAVTAGYVGLPLALATRALLGALPQALVLAAAVVVLITVGVLGVLRRTSTVLLPRGSGRRDSTRRDRRAGRPAGPAGPPARRSAPAAGFLARPAGRHRTIGRTQPAGRRSRAGAPAGR